MPVTYKRQDDLETLFEQFATIEQLEEVEFPDPSPSQSDIQKDHS